MKEFAYNIRYVVKHGRNLKNPWSVRHMAVYQRFDGETDSSAWILLQPADSVYQQLQENAVDSSGSIEADKHKKSLHLAFLWSTEKNWREYVNYLQDQFKILVRIFLLQCAFAFVHFSC